MLLPSLIHLKRPTDALLTPEDIFSTTLGSIFTDDLQNQHGDDPSTAIIYRSRRFGDLEFRTSDPEGEEQRRKFAHYLWNAGILMAELIGGGRGGGEREGADGDWGSDGEGEGKGGKNGEGMGEWWVSKEEEEKWNVEGETVLELGAGVGLSGIVATLSGAKEVTISDYPAPPLLQALTTNVAKNIPTPLTPHVRVQGHQWGILDTPFGTSHAHAFTRILAADCFWMPQEHDSLAASMLHFLSPDPSARVLCIAGFHTGRAKVAPFFEEVVPGNGLEVEDIWEMDANGRRREWRRERDGGREDMGERKKWLVLARLKRAELKK